MQAALPPGSAAILLVAAEPPVAIHLLTHRFDEEGLSGGHAGRCGCYAQTAGPGFLRSAVSEAAQLDQPIQHVVAAHASVTGMLAGVVKRGGLDDGGQQSRLRQGQAFQPVPEEHLGRRLDPVRAGAEVDRVYVTLEDLALGVTTLHLDRQTHLTRLPEERATRLSKERVLDVLLGDGASALDDLSLFEIAQCRARYALQVVPGMLKEPRILGGQYRVDERFRDVLVRNERSVLLEQPRQHGPVVGRDRGSKRQGLLCPEVDRLEGASARE